MSDFSRIGVVGAGFMGSGIAEAAAVAGLEVTVYEPEPAPLERSRDALEASVAKAVSRGKLSREDGDAVIERVQLHDHVRGPRRRRRGGRGGDRGSADQGPAVRAARPGASRGAVPGLEHVLDPGRRAGGLDAAPRAGDRPALLLAGAGDEAGRGGGRARHLGRRRSAAPSSSRSRSASGRSAPRTARGSSSTCCWCRT